MEKISNTTRLPTSSDLVAIFNLVADCAVNEFNGGGKVNSRMLLVTMDPVREGAVASMYMLPQDITDYFFTDAQSQAHIGPFIDDILCGHTEMRERLLLQGVVPDLVVVVNETWVSEVGGPKVVRSDGGNAVLVTIHQHDNAVTGSCKIEAETRVCTKGELDVSSLSIISAAASATMH